MARWGSADAQRSTQEESQVSIRPSKKAHISSSWPAGQPKKTKILACVTVFRLRSSFLLLFVADDDDDDDDDDGV
jgi:hypothetical protein